MLSSAIPALLSAAFAWNGDKNLIGVESNPPHATLEDGFPSITMQDIDTGGVPPDGKDFNGLFNWITQLLVWQNSGGLFKFDSVLADSIGGYPKGAVLQSNDGLSAYVSLQDNNLRDPNVLTSVGVYWAPWAGAVAGTGNYAVALGTGNAIFLTLIPVRTTYTHGEVVIFRTSAVNTTAVTLNAGGGALPLLRNDEVALAAGDLVLGGAYCAVYDSILNKFLLLTPVTSQLNQGNSGGGTPGPTNVTYSIPVGSILPFTGSTPPAGYLLCNGTTLGSSSSTAAIANDIWKPLYTILWATATTVWSAGVQVPKGASADADWTANKLINVPDYRGRTIVGAGQGVALTGRALGAIGGEETHLLTVGEMPSHTHSTTWPTFNETGTNADRMVSGGTTPKLPFGLSTNATGGGLAHNTMPPFAAASWIILGYYDGALVGGGNTTLISSEVDTSNIDLLTDLPTGVQSYGYVTEGNLVHYWCRTRAYAGGASAYTPAGVTSDNGNPEYIIGIRSGVFSKVLNITAQLNCESTDTNDHVFVQIVAFDPTSVNQFRLKLQTITTVAAAGHYLDAMVFITGVAANPVTGNVVTFSSDLTTGGVAPGAIMHYAQATPPNGWLEANGAAVSRTTYASLFAAIGTTFGTGNGTTTFTLPDLRGQFVRGWDHGKGVDAGRTLGSTQLDAFQGHRHEMDTTMWSGGIQWGLYGSGAAGTPVDRSSQYFHIGGATTDTVHGVPREAAETRPVNIALLACIKY